MRTGAGVMRRGGLHQRWPEDRRAHGTLRRVDILLHQLGRKAQRVADVVEAERRRVRGEVVGRADVDAQTGRESYCCTRHDSGACALTCPASGRTTRSCRSNSDFSQRSDLRNGLRRRPGNAGRRHFAKGKLFARPFPTSLRSDSNVLPARSAVRSNPPDFAVALWQPAQFDCTNPRTSGA